MEQSEKLPELKPYLMLEMRGYRAKVYYHVGDEGQVIFQQGVLGEALKKMIAADQDDFTDSERKFDVTWSCEVQ